MKELYEFTYTTKQHIDDKCGFKLKEFRDVDGCSRHGNSCYSYRGNKMYTDTVKEFGNSIISIKVLDCELKGEKLIDLKKEMKQECIDFLKQKINALNKQIETIEKDVSTNMFREIKCYDGRVLCRVIDISNKESV